MTIPTFSAKTIPVRWSSAVARRGGCRVGQTPGLRGTPSSRCSVEGASLCTTDVGVRPTTFAVALRNTGGLGLRREESRRGTLRACATIHLMRIAVLILGTMAAALAQDKPGAVIRIDVNLVQVDAVVT